MKITLARTGQAPLAFDGDLIAEEAVPPEPYATEKKDFRRWHELRLYRHEDGRHVLSIAFRSRHEAEEPHDDVFVFDRLADVAKALGDPDRGVYDPCEYLRGFPTEWAGNRQVRHSFQERQHKLEAAICDDFDNRVSRLLTQTGFSELL